MENQKRATVYFEAEVHHALRLKAAASDRSISEMVNDAVKIALAEDAEDLAAIDERKAERQHVLRVLRAGNAAAWQDIGFSSSLRPRKRSTQSARSRTEQRIVARLFKLSSEPHPPGCEKLVGPEGWYRIRQGDYRVVYLVDSAARIVEIIKVGHRREVYRKGK